MIDLLFLPLEASALVEALFNGDNVKESIFVETFS